MKAMLQITDTLPTAEAANQVLAGLALQDGYEYGRVMPPSQSKPGYRVQAFLRDDGSYIDGSMENVRRVMVPEGMENIIRMSVLTTPIKTYMESQAQRARNGPPYDPTHESQLAAVQSGQWISRHDLVLDPAIQGDERQQLLAEREQFLRARP